MINIGQLHGVGLGPGATDLMSVRADRLIRGAKHIAFLEKWVVRVMHGLLLPLLYLVMLMKSH